MRKIPLCLPNRRRARGPTPALTPTPAPAPTLAAGHPRRPQPRTRTLPRRRLAALLTLAPLLAIALALLAMLDGGSSGSRLDPDGGLASIIPGGIGIPGVGVGAPVPAAEAWGPGRQFKRTWALVKNASAVPDTELGDTANDDPGRCTIEVDINTNSGDHEGAGRGINKDTFCYSYTEKAIVTLTTSDDGIEKGYRAYVSTGRDMRDDGAQDWHPGIQTQDGRSRILGRAGLAEYNGKVNASAQRVITVTRAMATPHLLLDGAYFPNKNSGAVFLTVYTEDADGERGLGNLEGKIGNNGRLASLVHRKDFVVKIYFLNELDLGNTWVFITGVKQNDDGSRTFDEWCGRGNPPPCTGPTRYISASGYYHPVPRYAPPPGLDRRLILNDYWLTDDPTKNRYGSPGDDITSPGNPVGRSISSAPRSGIKYCIQLRDYAGNGYWHPGAEKTIRLVFAPGSNLSGASGQYEETRTERHFDAASGACNHLYLNGFNPAGPVRAEMQITINDGVNPPAMMEPFNIVIEGPPTSLRLTRTPTMRLNGGIRYVELHYSLRDAMGNALTGRRDRLTWRGADDATRAVIDRNGGGGTASGGRFLFPIKADAAAGTYTLRLTAGAGVDRDVSFVVYPLPTPASAIVPATISASATSGVVFAPGGRVNIRYTLFDQAGNPLPLSEFPVTWTTTAGAGVISEAGGVDGARQNDGRFGFDIGSNPAPGVYTVTIRTVATGADGQPLARQTVTFRIFGNPAQYAVSGADRVSPGGYALYTIRATDAAGNLPNLAGAYGRVGVSVSGASADAVRLFHIYDGSVTLNRQGVGYFRLRADRGADAGRVTVTVTGPDASVTGTRTVAIGAAP